jgi:hypothetical protein
MTTLPTLSRASLTHVSGGAQTARIARIAHNTHKPEAQPAPAAAVCNRQQFDWMAAHMVPDTGLAPGVQRHVIAHDAQVCGFPMPR